MTERNKRVVCLDPDDEPPAGPAGGSTPRVSHRHVRTMTLVAFARLYKIKLKAEDLATIGEQVVRLCVEKGVRPTEVDDERFGTIRLYPEWALRQFFRVDPEAVGGK